MLLPDDELLLVLSFGDVYTLWRCMQVCRAWQRLLHCEHTWLWSWYRTHHFYPVLPTATPVRRFVTLGELWGGARKKHKIRKCALSNPRERQPWDDCVPFFLPHDAQQVSGWPSAPLVSI